MLIFSKGKKGMRKVLFIDRDGTLIKEPHDFQIDAYSKLDFVPHSIPVLLKLKQLGFEFFMVSNQDLLGSENFPLASFQAPHDLMMNVFNSQGISFKEVLICPHGPNEGCSCRKPKVGLFKPTHFEGMDYQKSFVIGDRETDLTLAKNLGVKGIKINQDIGWEPVFVEIVKELNVVTKKRTTKETKIEMTLYKDGRGVFAGKTGIDFFDHMLDQICKHSGLSIDLNAIGDLEIDEHHLVEDIAITLGSSLRDLFDTGAGKERFGFVLPMDETQCLLSIDFSGRPFYQGNFTWQGDLIGNTNVRIYEHFFRSLAMEAKINLHLDVRGKDNHHLCESAFKSLGRCLRQSLTSSTDLSIPSSKGSI